MDVLTPEQRRLNMSRIRGKDTQPELLVRKSVHGLGFRFRLHVRGLPGAPDLVFRRWKKIIFVHGCFWHRHACRYGRPSPVTNQEFWQRKLLRNKQRDTQNRRALRRLGWQVMTVWECQTRSERQPQLAKRLAAFLKK